MEARPEWSEIAEDDRQEIAGRLHSDLPAGPEEGQAIARLKLLLVRQSALPGLREDLAREVIRRLPQRIQDSDEPARPVDLWLADLVKLDVIASENDLDIWLGSVRDVIASALAAGAPIRIRIRQ